MLFGLIFTLPTIPDRKSGQASTFPLLSSSGHEVASNFTWKFTNPSFRQTSLASGRELLYCNLVLLRTFTYLWGVGGRKQSFGCRVWFQGQRKVLFLFSLSPPPHHSLYQIFHSHWKFWNSTYRISRLKFCSLSRCCRGASSLASYVWSGGEKAEVQASSATIIIRVNIYQALLLLFSH